jgi:Family of unknown function (DUF6049)
VKVGVRRRSVAATVAATLLVGGPIVAAGAGGHGASAAVVQATNPATQVQVAVTLLTPRAPRPGQTLQVAGTLTNTGATALADVNVQLRVSTSAVQSRDELASLSGASARPPGDPVVSASVPDSLAPGGAAPFDLTIAVDRLGLGDAGVYPIAVEVIADDPATGARTRFGTARSFLPWDMAGTKPTRLAVVWPVSAGPGRGPDGVPTGTVLHDQLAGRLTELLQAAEGSDVSWLLDGDTLESAAVLAAGAPLRATGAASAGTTAGASGTTARPDPVAAAWLSRLRTQTAGAPVASLPYADIDIASVVRAGLSDDLDTATTLGVDVTAAVLGRTATGAVSALDWPAEGTADGTALAAVQQSGTDEVLLSDVYARPVRTTSYTPSGIGPLAGTALTAVTGDARLSRLLTTPAAQSGGAVLGEQRLLAETAMIGLELPSVSRSLVVVPPRGWTPDPQYVHSLLQVLGTASWVRVTQLADLVHGAGSGPSRQRPTYPPRVRNRELSAAQMGSVRDGHQQLSALTALLTDSQSVTDTYSRALLRAESAAWRGNDAGGRAYAGSVVTRLSALEEQVHLLPSGPITLTARSGRIPVTVVNDLDQQVTVRVQVTADPAVRMSLTQPAPVVLDARSSTTLDISADATTNGAVLVHAQLATLDGQSLGSGQTIPVQVTGFGAVAALLVGAALVLLCVALVVRIVRAIRTGRRPGSPASVRAPVR